MKHSSFNIYKYFNHQELRVLKDFYAGVPARRIRHAHCDLWPLLARHRSMEKGEYNSVKEALSNI